MLMYAALAGCAGLAVERMMPTNAAAPAPRFDGSLRVLPVTGARDSQFGGPALISNEMYREALVSALRKSNLFRRVETDGAGDYALHTDLVAQGQSLGLDYRSSMVAQYRITEMRSGAERWKRGFNSRHEVTVGQALSGATRTTMAQEGSVRENLAQLITALSTAELK